MSKRTKKELEQEIADLKARVAEQSATIARLTLAPWPAAPTYIPYPVPQPCTRPHSDGVYPVPYIPYVPSYPIWPQYPTYPTGPYWGGAIVPNGPAFGGAAGCAPTFVDNALVVQNYNACCAAPMLGNVWVGEVTSFAVAGSTLS